MNQRGLISKRRSRALLLLKGLIALTRYDSVGEHRGDDALPQADYRGLNR
jgi:hypothetical protein